MIDEKKKQKKKNEPLLPSYNNSTSIVCALHFITRTRVPLHRPSATHQFFNNIKMQPIFVLSLCGGKPLGVVLLANSIGYSSASSVSSF